MTEKRGCGQARKVRNVLSLFSGAGGMDLGFEGGFTVRERSVNSVAHPDWIEERFDAGWVRLRTNSFQTVFANDIFPSAKVAWEKYFGARRGVDGVYHLESVVDLARRERSGQRLFPRGVEVVTGGFPCNDFSLAGRRLGFDSHKSHTGARRQVDQPSEESRGKLYMWMREVVDLVQPKVFIAENVKGLVSLGDVKRIIEQDFANVGGGYAVVDAKVLHATEYGVPQTRERIFFIGFRKSALRPAALKALTSSSPPESYDPYPPPTHVFAKLKRKPHGALQVDFVPSGDYLLDLPEPTHAGDLAQRSYSKARYMGTHCQGQKEIQLDKPAPTIRAEHHGNIEYRRLAAEHGGVNQHELGRGMKERRLTVRECARLQTFPDDYPFVFKSQKSTDGQVKHPELSATNAYRLIGNAVPPLLAYHLARRLERLWPALF